MTSEQRPSKELLDRLRLAEAEHCRQRSLESSLLGEAADEIERLQRERDEYRECAKSQADRAWQGLAHEPPEESYDDMVYRKVTEMAATLGLSKDECGRLIERAMDRFYGRTFQPPEGGHETDYRDALREIAGYEGVLDSTAELMRQCARDALSLPPGPSPTKSAAPCRDEQCPTCLDFNVSPYICKVHGDNRKSGEPPEIERLRGILRNIGECISGHEGFVFDDVHALLEQSNAMLAVTKGAPRDPPGSYRDATGELVIPSKHAGHIYSPREGTEMCGICGFHKREHAPEHMPAGETRVVQDMEKIAWCQKVHEDLALYIKDGDGIMIHTRAHRALGIMFDELQKLISEGAPAPVTDTRR